MALRTRSQDDWIMRQIQAVAAAIARALGRRQAGEHLEALGEVERAHAELLGNAHALVARVDAATAAHLIGDARVLGALAQITREEGRIREEMGDAEGAERLARRARELARQALQRDPELAAAREVAGEA